MTIETRLLVEDFIFQEAEYLDDWELDAWMALWTQDEARYEIGPLGLGANVAAQNPDPGEVLFMVADDRFRLEQRVIRLKKKTCHVEYPHSHTRHLYTNVRVKEDDGENLFVRANCLTCRTKRGETVTYPGEMHYHLKRASDGSFGILSKRIYLDLDALDPQGKVSIIL